MFHFPSKALQVAILRRWALLMGLPPARLENGQNNYFLYKAFMYFRCSLQLAILLLFQSLGGMVKLPKRYFLQHPKGYSLWATVIKLTIFQGRQRTNMILGLPNGTPFGLPTGTPFGLQHMN